MKELREAGRKSHEKRLKSFGGKSANKDFGGMGAESPLGSAAQGEPDAPATSTAAMGNPAVMEKKGGFVHGDRSRFRLDRKRRKAGGRVSGKKEGKTQVNILIGKHDQNGQAGPMAPPGVGAPPPGPAGGAPPMAPPMMGMGMPPGMMGLPGGGPPPGPGAGAPGAPPMPLRKKGGRVAHEKHGMEPLASIMRPGTKVGPGAGVHTRKKGGRVKKQMGGPMGMGPQAPGGPMRVAPRPGVRPGFNRPGFRKEGGEVGHNTGQGATHMDGYPLSAGSHSGVGRLQKLKHMGKE